MFTVFREYISDTYKLFYPKICGACDNSLLKGEEHLCFICSNNLPYTRFEKIRDNPAEKIFAGRIPIEFATSLLFFSKAELTQKILHNIKYNYRKQLAVFTGKKLGESILSAHTQFQFDAIIPVPLHQKKELLRGYNQSYLIAEGIATVLNIPVYNKIIRRTKNTDTQTKKSRSERWENINNVFETTETAIIQNKHLLLVDDVLTSGATLEACVAALKLNENIKVSIATLAIAF